MKRIKIINLIIILLCACLFFSILKLFFKSDVKTKAATTDEAKVQMFLSKCNELKTLTVLKGDIEAQQNNKSSKFTVEYQYEINDLPIRMENNIPVITLGEFSLKLRETKTDTKDKAFKGDVWNTVCSSQEYKRKALNNAVNQLNKLAREYGLKIKTEIIDGGMMQNDLVEIVKSNVK